MTEKSRRRNISYFSMCCRQHCWRIQRHIQVTHYMKFIPLVVIYKNYKAGLLYLTGQVYITVHILPLNLGSYCVHKYTRGLNKNTADKTQWGKCEGTNDTKENMNASCWVSVVFVYMYIYKKKKLKSTHFLGPNITVLKWHQQHCRDIWDAEQDPTHGYWFNSTCLLFHMFIHVRISKNAQHVLTRAE